MADQRKGKLEWRDADPGNCVGCGMRAKGWYRPTPDRGGGAAEALVPHSPYDDEEAASGKRLASRLGFRSISGRY